MPQNVSQRALSAPERCSLLRMRSLHCLQRALATSCREPDYPKCHEVRHVLCIDRKALDQTLCSDTPLPQRDVAPRSTPMVKILLHHDNFVVARKCHISTTGRYNTGIRHMFNVSHIICAEPLLACISAVYSSISIHSCSSSSLPLFFLVNGSLSGAKSSASWLPLQPGSSQVIRQEQRAFSERPDD